MGEVYRARDPQLQRDVAIKVLPAAFSRDPDRQRRFEQEARATGSLNHPNILAVHDIGVHEGATWIVAELLEGETLRQRMDARPLPPRAALDYAIQIANGLAAAHEHDIVHRDIKPANLFVTQDGRIKILDFGLAKLLSPEASGDATETVTLGGVQVGPVIGTPMYMSPEQVHGLRTDHRSDIFSFGTVLFEMLAGFPPFRRSTDCRHARRDRERRATKFERCQSGAWCAGTNHSALPGEATRGALPERARSGFSSRDRV